MRAREQLRHGASQIKLMAGGGVSSPYNPIESTQYTEAGNSRRGRGRRELGHLRDRPRIHAACDPTSGRRRRQVHRARPVDRRATAKLLAEKGIWWSLQPLLDDEDMPPMNPVSQKKAPASIRRNRQRLQAGEEIQGQDGLWHRHLVRAHVAPAARERSSPSWSAGTHPPKRSRWPPPTTAS